MEPLTHFIRAKDVAVFKRVAKRFNVYIAVRRTNPAALPYIERPGYVPKGLDCKFKTADRNVLLPDGVRATVAGLVVSPAIRGMEGAFASRAKYVKAMEIWNKYAPVFVWQEGDIPMSSKPYHVDTNATSPHYGALKAGYIYNRASAKFIHGDYDLYDIVDGTKPEEHVIVSETSFEWRGLGKKGVVPHVRVPEFADVQNNLNIGFGAPMVQHGSQAGFSDYTEDDIDCFFPDGITVRSCLGEAQIRQLYATEFKGRAHLFRDEHGNWAVPVSPAFGRWVRG